MKIFLNNGAPEPMQEYGSIPMGSGNFEVLANIMRLKDMVFTAEPFRSMSFEQSLFDAAISLGIMYNEAGRSRNMSQVFRGTMNGGPCGIGLKIKKEGDELNLVLVVVLDAPFD